jgi:hypothetical protein
MLTDSKFQTLRPFSSHILPRLVTHTSYGKLKHHNHNVDNYFMPGLAEDNPNPTSGIDKRRVPDCLLWWTILSLCVGILEIAAIPVIWRFSDLGALELYVL